MKKIILILIIFLLYQTLCFCGELKISGLNSSGLTFNRKEKIKFGLITDMHYNQTFPERLNGLNETINTSQVNKCDFLITLGDMIDGDDAEENIINIKNFEDTLRTFGSNIYCAMGNHDTQKSTLAGYLSNSTLFNQWTVNSSIAYYSFDNNGYHIIVLHTGEGSYFSMSNEQLSWLQSDLASSTLPKIVFSHHGLALDYPGNLSNITEEGDTSNQLSSWSFEGANLTNSNYFRYYWNLTNSGTTRTVDLYKNSTKDLDSKVASGNRVNDGIISLSQVSSSNLTGNVSIVYSSDDTTGNNNITLGDWVMYPYSDYCFNSSEVKQYLVADGNVTASFRGHGHVNSFIKINGINYYEIPAVSNTGNPHSVASIYDDNSIFVNGYNATTWIDNK